MDALGRASQGWGPHAELESILASDDHIIAVFHAISEQDGKTLDVVLAEPVKVNLRLCPRVCLDVRCVTFARLILAGKTSFMYLTGLLPIRWPRRASLGGSLSEISSGVT
jgi:hypothetical protein